MRQQQHVTCIHGGEGLTGIKGPSRGSYDGVTWYLVCWREKLGAFEPESWLLPRNREGGDAAAVCSHPRLLLTPQPLLWHPLFRLCFHGCRWNASLLNCCCSQNNRHKSPLLIPTELQVPHVDSKLRDNGDPHDNTIRFKTVFISLLLISGQKPLKGR